MDGALLGSAVSVAALVVALITLGALATGRRQSWVVSLGPVVVALLLSLSVACLAGALVSGDYRLVYVAEASARSSSWPYRLAGLWGGMAGSLLFWTWLLSLVAVGGTRFVFRRRPDVATAAAVTLTALTAAFLAVSLVLADPFDRLAVPAIDGAGLTPILEYPAMIYHPPLLYLGLVSTAVPFALAVAGLVRQACDSSWLDLVRRTTALSWLVLSIGMLAGAHWAYVELGWGGFWAWDPVENASLLPWLAVTATVHAAMIDQYRGRVRSTTVALAMAPLVLALVGTLLTRSGAVSSVHAFGEARAVGRALLAVVVVTTAGAGALWWRRRPRAAGATEAGPARFNRRTALAGNAVVLVGLAVVVAWGTLFPLVADLAGRRPFAVSGRFFALLASPFALATLALVGLAPVLRWRGGLTPGARRLLPAAAVAVVLGAGAAVVTGLRSPFALAALPLAAGSAVLLASELARRLRAPGPVVARRRAAGGVLAHLGVVVLLAGVAGATSGRGDTVVLAPGTTANVGDYRLSHQGASAAVAGDDGRGTAPAAADQAGGMAIDEVRVITVEVGVSRGGEAVATLYPEQAVFERRGLVLAETALRSTPVEDLKVAIRRVGEDGTAVLDVAVRPLAAWVWWGGILLIAGGALAFARPPSFRPRPTEESAGASPHPVRTAR